MSVVAVKIDNDYINIASDSIVLKDGLKRTNFKKLIKINDNLIVGGCGVAEEIVLFFEFLKTYNFCETSVKGVLDCMKSFSAMKEEYTQDGKIENSYILIINNTVFEVECFFVQQVTNFTAIGEGETYALSALQLQHNVEEAVQVACDLCCYISGPIIKYSIKI